MYKLFIEVFAHYSCNLLIKSLIVPSQSRPVRLVLGSVQLEFLSNIENHSVSTTHQIQQQ